MTKLMSVKDCGGKEIIMEVGLAVIGVALLILFRSQVSTMVTTILGKATQKIETLFDAV